MSESLEQYVVKTYDHYGDECLKDFSLPGENLIEEQSNRGPKGYVEVYERDVYGNENLLGKHNLVVYNGRELIAQKIVNIVNPNCVTDLDEYICWFGVGSGGANPGDPFNPSPPLNNDTDLYNPAPISATDATCADFTGGYFYKAPIEEVTFEVDPLNENSWLILRTVTTLGIERSVGEELNEAGLFTAFNNTPGYSGAFHLFARITFPTLVKTNTRELIFIWYLFT